MKDKNGDDKIPDYCLDNVWKDGKCSTTVTKDGLKASYDFWLKSESRNVGRKGRTFEQFLEETELVEVNTRLLGATEIVCNSNARQCSCTTMYCRVHYAEHLTLVHGRDGIDSSPKGDDKPKDPPTSGLFNRESVSLVSPIAGVS